MSSCADAAPHADEAPRADEAVPALEMTREMLEQGPIVLYGPSESGKTAMIGHLLGKLQDRKCAVVSRDASKLEKWHPDISTHHTLHGAIGAVAFLRDQTQNRQEEHVDAHQEAAASRVPRLVLVLDDCVSGVAGLSRDVNFRRLYYQGRHDNIVLIIAVQDDTGIHANFRKNASLSIFCAGCTASAFFAQPANRFSSDVKARAQNALQTVFEEPNRKLVFAPHASQNFYSCKAGPLEGEAAPEAAPENSGK